MKTKFQQAVNRCIHIFLIRNKYYGNSFADQEYSILNLPCSQKVFVRMEDKFRRLMHLLDVDNTSQENIPKIIDTLIDLTNYAIIAKMLLMSEEINKPVEYPFQSVNSAFRHYIKKLELLFTGQTDGEQAFDDLVQWWKELGSKAYVQSRICSNVAFSALIFAIWVAGDKFDDYFNLVREDTE